MSEVTLKMKTKTKKNVQIKKYASTEKSIKLIALLCDGKLQKIKPEQKLNPVVFSDKNK